MDFPLAFPSGSHPQMKVSFGPAISVGYESRCEYFDVDLAKKMDVKEAGERLASQMPEGFWIERASRIPLFFPSLESLINRADYDVRVPEEFLERTRADGFPSPEEFFGREDLALEKTKKAKSGAVKAVKIPLKPLVARASWKADDGDAGEGNGLFFSLKFGPGKNVKPEKIAALFLGLTGDETRLLVVNRKSFWIEKAGGETEP